MLLLCGRAGADPLRLALFQTELQRKAPGLLYRDILSEKKDVLNAAHRAAQAQADVLVLLGFDFDYNNIALTAFARAIRTAGGPDYQTLFALRPNTGMATGVDLNRDGKRGTPHDAQSYGDFAGQGGMAILSTLPIARDRVQDFSAILWADLPWAQLPQLNGVPYMTPEMRRTQRLSSTGHWVVPVDLGQNRWLNLMVYHASPPVFDGPEDRNGLRDADETLFWVHYLNDTTPGPFAIMGDANIDPSRGEGHHAAIHALLTHPALRDPFPQGTRTVDWSDIGLGKMRVDYILPAAEISVLDQGTIWPNEPPPDTSRHALIWVDLFVPP